MLLLIIPAIVLQVFAGVGSDLVSELLKNEVVHLTIPRSMPADSLSRVSGIQEEIIKSFSDHSLFLSGHNVRITETFKNARTHLVPSTFYGQVRVEGLPNVVFKAPENAAGWEYGQKRFLESREFVELQQATLESEMHDWSASSEKIKAKITVLATKYSQVDGHGDVVLVEKIVKVLPRKTPPNYIPPYFYMGGYGLRVSKMVLAVNVNIMGVDPPALYEGKTAIRVLGTTDFKIPKDMSSWKLGETRTLESTEPVLVLYRARDAWGLPWRAAAENREKILAKVTRYEDGNSNVGNRGSDLLVIHEIFTPSFVNGQLRLPATI